MLKKLYDRCVELARHKFSKPLLGFVAFIESFFFPVPPDLMIVPMVVAKREDYLKIFLIATTGSVLGGLFGYMLGVFFLDASMVIIEFYGYEEKVFEMQDKMSTNCLLYTSDAADDTPCVDLGGRRIIKKKTIF